MKEIQNITELAKKFRVNETFAGYDAGCPGIMSPLGETPAIETSWFFWSNEDKTHRAQQFSSALNLLDNFGKHSNEVFKNEYLKLSIFGRAMVFNIANKQDSNFKNDVLSTISPYAKESLQENPFKGKSNVSAEAIFKKYITPIADKFSQQNEIISNNTNEIVFVENQNDENDEELQKVIEESLKISQQENQTTISNSNLLNTEPITEESLIEKEKILVGKILESTVYKSSSAIKLNEIIKQINDLNLKKFKFGMIKEEVSEIELLTNDRINNSIDSDILKFFINSQYTLLMKDFVFLQVIYLYKAEGYMLSGGASQYIENLVDNLENIMQTTNVSGDIQEHSDN